MKCSRIASAMTAKRAQPAPHRRRRPAQGLRRSRRWPLPSRLGRQSRPDDLDAVAPAHQGVFGDQHVRGGAGPADRAPEAPPLAALQEAHLTFDPVSPGPQAKLAVRAAEAASDQVRLDGGLVSPYDEHSGAPASLGRAPSRSVQKVLARGLLRVQFVLTLTPPCRPVKPSPQRNPVLSDRGAATAVTNPCSRSAAANGPVLLKQRGAQHTGRPLPVTLHTNST